MVFSGCVISCSVKVAMWVVVRFSSLRLSEGRPIIPAAVSVISVWPSFFFKQTATDHLCHHSVFTWTVYR